MHLGKQGTALIKDSEGYLHKLPNGDCQAYRCPAGVWTIGWGSTTGIREGMVWTRHKAEQQFIERMLKYEFAVDQLVKVPLNQNEYDALVSFTYNCGEGVLAKSSILRLLNKGDRVGAARAFSAYIKYRDPNTKQLKVARGLVTRRAREAALFLKPVTASEISPAPTLVLADTPPAPMPQSVEAPTMPKRSRKGRLQRLMTWLSGGGAVVGVAKKAGENIETAQTFVAPFNTFLSDYGFSMFLAAALVCLIAAAAMLYMQEQDAKEGRYHEKDEVTP